MEFGILGSAREQSDAQHYKYDMGHTTCGAIWN